jgi:putative SOS response-associated peptidase YedK
MIFRLNYQVLRKLERIDEELKLLYQEKDEYIRELHDRYGSNAILIKKQKDSWMKITLTDDSKKLIEGKSVFRPARFNKFELNKRTLVNKPKEANEVYK